MMGRRAARPSGAKRAAGFTLIELMVSITIGLFVVGALSAVFINVKSTFQTQSGLATLHDSERLALSILTTEVQLAGYFPDPTVNTAASDLPADAAAQTYGQFAAGQGVTGVSGTGGASDIFAIRFATASGDGLMNCQGGVNATAGVYVMVSVFSISGNQELQCAVNGLTPVVLVNNVPSMSILYGTDTGGLGNVDMFLTASAVTAANAWPNVKSLKITLNFVNPYLPGQVGASPPAVAWIQNIAIMGTL